MGSVHNGFTMRLLIILIIACPLMATNDLYIAATSTGGNTGADCSNAKAYSYFNSSGNWSGLPTGVQIGPDTTVHICGTITDSLAGTLLTAQGSGTSGHPVTIQLELNASLQSPGETTFINGNGQSYFVITGSTTCGWINLASVSCTGSIYNTLDGYSGQTCPGGPCSNQVQTQAINGFASNLEVRNLLIGPIYIHGNTSDLTFTSPGPKCIDFTNGSTTNPNWNFHNLTMHDAAWCLNGGGNGVTLANSEIYNIDHGMGMGVQSDTAVTNTPVTVHDNYIHDQGNWDQSNNAFHHDGVHLFASCASVQEICPNTTISGVNIYNNVFGGNYGANYNSQVFLEGNINGANVFNNVNIATTTSPSPSQLGNGFTNGNGQNINIFNNTVLGYVANTTAGSYHICGNYPWINVLFENNACMDFSMVSMGQYNSYPQAEGGGCPYTSPQGIVNCVSGSYTINSNAYLMVGAGHGENTFGACPSGASSGSSCNTGLNFDAADFATFQSITGSAGDVFCDQTDPAGNWISTSTGQELAGGSNLCTVGGTTYTKSPTIAAGTNLTSFCTGLGISGNPCLTDIAGNSRPSSGGWDIGAYQFQATITSSGYLQGATFAGSGSIH